MQASGQQLACAALRLAKHTLGLCFGRTIQSHYSIALLDVSNHFPHAVAECSLTLLIAARLHVQVYQKLLDAGLQPISTTYTALISAFGKAGQLDKAMDTFNTMIQQGCERSVITYSALISACEKAGRWELALEVFDKMQQEGCNPNTVTYNSLITACQQGALQTASLFLMCCQVCSGITPSFVLTCLAFMSLDARTAAQFSPAMQGILGHMSAPMSCC